VCAVTIRGRSYGGAQTNALPTLVADRLDHAVPV